MSEYHQLENDIILLFKSNITEDENEVEKMKNLVEIFDKYWKIYQDSWSDHYWKIYEYAHKQSFMGSNDQDNFNNKNTEICNNEIELNNSASSKNKNAKNINDGEKNNNIRNNNTNTNIQTRTLTNLHEIDEELDNINELSIIKEKKNTEKNRSCFDCKIF